MPKNPVALLRLLQLSSPTLPVGAYAYSQGAEAAVHAGLVHDEFSAQAWINELLLNSFAYGDLALLSQCYAAWSVEDHRKLTELVQLSLAIRETSELKQEDLHIAKALMRLAIPLKVGFPEELTKEVTYPWVFARFAQVWQIPLEEALQAFAWSWLENQVAAMIKLVPLGQTQGQMIILGMDECIQGAVRVAMSLEQDDIGSSLPNLAILSRKSVV